MALSAPRQIASKSAYNGTSVFPSAPLVGNTIIVTVWTWNDNLSGDTVSDNYGNTYTRDVSSWNTSAGAFGTAVFRATVVATGASFTLSTSNSAHVITGIEMAGLASPALDTTAGNFGSTASGTTGSTGTLAQADEIAIVVATQEFIDGTESIGIPTGFTLIQRETDNNGSQAGVSSYQIVSATTALNPSFTLDGASAWSACIATYKGASGGGPTTTNHGITVTSAAAATIRRSVGKRVTATASCAASIRRAIAKRVAATITGTASVLTSKALGVLISVTSSGAASIVRRTGKSLAAMSAASLIVTRHIAKTFNATSTGTGSLVRSVAKALSVASASTAGLAVGKAFLRAVSVTSTATASVVTSKALGVIVSVTSTGAATIRRSVGKVLSMTSSASPSVRKSVTKTLTVTGVSAASVGRGLSVVVSVISLAVATVFATLRRGSTGGVVEQGKSHAVVTDADVSMVGGSCADGPNGAAVGAEQGVVHAGGVEIA